MTRIDIQVSRSKVKPIVYMLGKGGISVLQTSVFNLDSMLDKSGNHNS